MTASKKKDTLSTPSRYQRVKNILNAAQGNYDVLSYQGNGRFWELPLEKFLEVQLYGVPMIAPEGEVTPVGGSMDDTDCDCGCCTPINKPNASGAKRCVGRGAASGLIKGLKGQVPFDGTQFPPLLWGPTAKPVAESDVQFIQDWIDDCCPETDEPETADSKVVAAQLVALAYGDLEHKSTPRALNEHKGLPGSLKVRKNIESLSPDELARFRSAICNMQRFDKYPQDERSFAYWAKMHADMCQHGWEQFLTWHRAYLYFFEQRLQDVDPTVTLPYWDWAMYADQNKAAAKKNPPAPKSQPNGQKQFSHDTGIIPGQYGCWLDDSGLVNLKGKIDQGSWDKLAKVKGKVYLSGNRLYKAAGIQYQGGGSNGVLSQDDLIMAELQRINPLWHRQRWPGMNTGLISHYPTPGDIERIMQTPDFAHWGGGPSSDHFFGSVESVHNFMHNFSGGLDPNYILGNNPELYIEPQYGHMVEARVTAFDPIFWGHHSNVDRLWAQWQGLHPGVNPQELDAPLAPFEMTVADTIHYKDLGYEYMQDAHYFPTNNQVGMVRFRSEQVGISRRVLQNHSRVEIRLHAVQLTERGANIRVFLNQPEATAETPIERNDNYVGNFVSFVGFCYGGPGHCNVPPATRRPFDHRMRHHKTPGNLRFDATKTIQKLLGAHKAKSAPLPISVHLVVTDIKGETRDDLLKLDGVSVNFIQ